MAGWRDGTWWNREDALAKLNYVIGVLDGTSLGNRFSMWAGIKGGELEEWASKAGDSYSKYEKQYLESVKVGQIADGVNEFYKDYRNRSISVTDGIWIVLNEIAGKSKSEMETMIENFRKYAKSVVLVFPACNPSLKGEAIDRKPERRDVPAI